MEVLASVVSLPLRALVLGLQAATVLALAGLSICLIITLLWNKAWVQNLVQIIANYIPIMAVINISKLQKVEVSPKIDTDHCSICYCDIDKEVVSSCGHVFCGDCLIKFWQSKKKIEKIACPLCRRDVNVIVPTFAVSGCSNSQEYKSVVESINHYNISCSSCPTTILHLILGSPSSMKLFVESLPNRKGFGSVIKGFFGFLYTLAVLIYFVSPTELVPDSEMTFGWVDDSASFVYLLLYVILLIVMVA